MPARITVAQLETEYDEARRSGSPSEIADLAFLVARAKGHPCQGNAAAARNRQAQRRYNRRTPRDANTTAAKTARVPMVGDWVEDPSGARWKVTRVGPSTAWHDVPGEPLINCAFDLCKLVDGPGELATVSAQAPTPAGETLYHAIWDALDVEECGPAMRNALETALRAYEASLT